MNTAHKISAAAGLTLAILTGATAAWAHHSAAMYDAASPKTLEGTVKSLNWVNPHVTLEFLVTEKPGATPVVWTAEMSSPGVLTRAGWTKRSFNPGERVTVELAPLRDGRPGGGFRKATNQATGQTLTWNFKAGERPGLQ